MVVQTLLRTSAVVAALGWLAAVSVTADSVRRGSAPSARRSAAVQLAPAATAAAKTDPIHRALLDKYCITCHNEKLKTAGLVLEQQRVDLDHPSAGAETWEKVIRKLRSGTMPPTGAPRPDRAAVDAFRSWLETSIDHAAAVAPNPGRPGVHRLNRVEYTNAIRDLLGLEMDGRALLPADDSSYGFDNVADVLSVSTGLLERYLIVAKKVSRLAIGDPSIRPVAETYRIPMARMQEDRMSEDLPFGSRGGFSVRQMFPTDGEYEFRLRLQRNSINLSNAIRGLDEDNVIDVWLDGSSIKRFAIPANSTVVKQGVNAARTEGRAAAADIEAALNVSVPVKAGTRVVGISFTRRHWYVEGVGVSRLPPASDAFGSGLVSSRDYGKVEMGVDSLEIKGPFSGNTPAETPSRRRIFVCRPASASREESCAKTILSTLARRAYRRPVTTQDVETLIGFYKAGRSKGTFDEGVQAGLERMLLSPYFLVRKEEDPPNSAPGSIHRVSDVELASRLSFFLWSSIPDDQLLDVAIRGKLKDPAVLDQQVRRMLRDPRSNALVTNFFGQWLYLRNIDTQRPDQKTFPEFDENLREAFRRETELFIESQLREDRSVTELLTADYTFLNERLARHYGIPHVYGSHFRRVTLTDNARGGLLGQGSILTVTSYANRTSPVVRGKWLLENLLGAPPPPPPPNVPPFPENTADGQPQSVRARMEQHRRNPVCAQCHSKIDPLGFALENFDAVGSYRTTDDGAAVDASGTLPDGTAFNGPAEFRKALVGHREEFVATLTEKLLTYAMGRGVENYDMPAVRAIVRDSASSAFQWSSLISAIVRSTPFQMKRSES